LILDSFVGTTVRLGEFVHRLLEQYVSNQFINVGKVFEHSIVLIAVTAFLLITVFLLIRQARKLPKYYVIETIDQYGRNVVSEGLRVIFRTRDVAKSYSQFYQSLYGERFQFRVTGLRRILDLKKNTC